MQPRSVFQKIWDDHLVDQQPDGTCLIYVDRHLVHEVSSPQAFEGLRVSGRRVHRPAATFAVVDHNVPTTDRSLPIADPESATQIETLEANCRETGIQLFDLSDPRQGIVHVVGPEQGLTLPGTTIVCGDSHTATHGAFGALAFGIGTSEVEHVLATQTLLQQPLKSMRISIEGALHRYVTSKDLILSIIGKIGTAGGTGHVIEYAGEVIRALSMESRMTICNMSIEAGARAGLIAPDEKTFQYLKGRPFAPKGDLWAAALSYWQTLTSDQDAKFDQDIRVNASTISPQTTWGTSPQDVIAIDECVPDPAKIENESRRQAMERALAYMDLRPHTPMTAVRLDRVFIGSCTNARIEDLRAAASILKGRKIADHVNGIVVPGSGLVKKQAEEEGLDRIFIEAGFEWREAGCSMCVGMNPDQLLPGERCASTSNRNFEGRQGKGGRTHLVSPLTAAASAISGTLADVRKL